MLFTHEVKLVSAYTFGPCTSTQRPDKIVNTGGWKAVGVLSTNGENFIVLHRRRWFWTDWSLRKGGINPEPSRVIVRPPPPGPMRRKDG